MDCSKCNGVGYLVEYSIVPNLKPITNETNLLEMLLEVGEFEPELEMHTIKCDKCNGLDR